VREKVHAPVYASFGGAPGSEMLSLYGVLDISDDGVTVQCPSPIDIDQVEKGKFLGSGRRAARILPTIWQVV
jgi:hypothetical protein